MAFLDNAGTIKKTRGGCLTCKRRHVKCDEARPTCQRCVRGHRVCEGYNNFVAHDAVARRRPQASEILSISSVKPQILTINSGEAEWQAYSAHYGNATFFGKPFDNEFWRDLVVKVGNQEPGIRYAIFALGNLTRQVDADHALHSGACVCQHCRLALTSYNKAISSITNRQFSHSKIHVPLVACILFIGLEFVQGNTEKGLMLLEKGNSLFTKVADDVSLATHPMLRALNPIFERLRLLSGLFGHPCYQVSWPHSSDYRPDIATSHDLTPEALRDSLFHIMTRGHLIIQQTLKLTPREFLRDLESMPSGSPRLRLVQELEEWSARLDTFRSSLGRQRTAEEFHKLAVLDAYHNVTKVWISTITHLPKAENIDVDTKFRRLVHAAASVLKDSSSVATQSPFTFEMGFMPPLYFAANRCRHPVLRRRALELLHLTSPREAAWERAEVLAVAKRVIELEENNGGIIVDDPTSLDSRYTITKNARLIASVDMAPSSPDANGKRRVRATFQFYDTSDIDGGVLEEILTLDADARLPAIT